MIFLEFLVTTLVFQKKAENKHLQFHNISFQREMFDYLNSMNRKVLYFFNFFDKDGGQGGARDATRTEIIIKLHQSTLTNINYIVDFVKRTFVCFALAITIYF